MVYAEVLSCIFLTKFVMSPIKVYIPQKPEPNSDTSFILYASHPICAVTTQGLYPTETGMKFKMLYCCFY
jgi:hypothetical protein